MITSLFLRDAAAWLYQHHGPGPGVTRDLRAPQQYRKVFTPPPRDSSSTVTLVTATAAGRSEGKRPQHLPPRRPPTPLASSATPGPQPPPSLLKGKPSGPATRTGLPESLRHAGRAQPPTAEPDEGSPAPLTCPGNGRRSPARRNRQGRGFFSNPTNGSARRRAGFWEGGRCCGERLDGKCSLDRAVEGGRDRPAGLAVAGGGFLSGGGWALRWGWATRGCLLGLLCCTHPEPSGPTPSAAAGPRLPREGSLASPGLPRGLPSPARLAACSARAVPPSALTEGYM